MSHSPSETAGRIRLRLDRSYARYDSTIVGGSPLRVIRLSPAGVEAARRLEAAGAASGTSSEAVDVDRTSLSDRLVAIGAAHPVPARPGRFTSADVTIVMPVHRRRSTAAGHADDRAGRGDSTGAATAITTVLVDDGSEPPIADATVRLETNRGPAAARMAGLERVTTPLVAFIDDDVDLGAGGVVPVLDGLLGHFDDDAVALVAPRVRSGPAAAPSGAARRIAAHERRHSSLDLGDRPARIAPGTAVSYVPAAVIVCRVDALRAVGGFDTDLRVGEDVDLVWRLVAAGFVCRYEPSVVVEHRPRPTWSAFARQRIAYGTSSAALAERGHSLAPVRANGWSLGIWGLVAGGHPVLGGTVALATAVALVRRLAMLPPEVSIRLALGGTWQVGRLAAMAVRRVWWPILLPVALVSRRVRTALVVALVAAGDPLVVVDDICFSIGVWRGIARAARSPSPERWRGVLGPVLPEITPWPERSGAPQRPATDEPVRSGS